MAENVIFERTLTKVGNSILISISPEHRAYLEAEKGTKMLITDGRHDGKKCLIVWVKD